MSILYELAALSTALLWSFTAIFFSEAGKRIGSYFVNKIRLVFATIIYGIILLFLSGVPWPSGLNSEQWFWLTLSGLIGLVFGDGCGFKSLVMIGPRLATLVMASTPIFTTLIAWFFLGETLKLIDILGISITIGGIAWVILERNNNGSNLHQDHPDSGTLVKGVFLAFCAAAGQAAGLVLSKKGMLQAGGEVSPLVASAVRIMTAVILIWTFSAFRGTVGQTIQAAKNKKAVLFSLAGAIAGPFLGVWMSLVAVAKIKAGIAATLNATTPVLIIPTLIFVYHEKISWRAVIGAVVAISGVALLLLG